MINAIINGLLSIVTGLINLICWPIDSMISAAFPNLTESITGVTETFITIFSYITYPIGFLPSSLIHTLLLIFSTQVIFLGVLVSYWGIVRVWHMIQKIKFW